MNLRIYNKTGKFGNTLFETLNVRLENETVKIENPLGGTFYIYDKDNGVFYDSYDYKEDNYIIRRKKRSIFRKNTTKKVLIYFINEGTLNIKNAIQKMGYDVSYYKVPIDIWITYDINISFAEGQIYEFHKFVQSNNFKNGTSIKEIFKSISPRVNSIIKDVMGKEILKKSVEEIDSSNLKISNEILDKLNYGEFSLYNHYGLLVKDFIFNITDEYKHREEKKRVIRNRALKKEL